jgi:hypothetical protein
METSSSRSRWHHQVNLYGIQMLASSLGREQGEGGSRNSNNISNLPLNRTSSSSSSSNSRRHGTQILGFGSVRDGRKPSKA